MATPPLFFLLPVPFWILVGVFSWIQYKQFGQIKERQPEQYKKFCESMPKKKFCNCDMAYHWAIVLGRIKFTSDKETTKAISKYKAAWILTLILYLVIICLYIYGLLLWQ
ncbi:MAG: hypothetical protein QXK06_03320 [Candidatus Diapherotrites archaeon]